MWWDISTAPAAVAVTFLAKNLPKPLSAGLRWLLHNPIHIAGNPGLAPIETSG